MRPLFRRDSIRARLLIAAAVWLTLALLGAWWVIGGVLDRFVTDRFDAEASVAAAVAAGMGYAVLTTKHHEGFALWDSALTDYTAPAACGRDLVREFVDAARTAGLRVGLYHSLIDWHHPDFTIDWVHPLRERADVVEVNATRDMARYREFLHGQVA